MRPVPPSDWVSDDGLVAVGIAGGRPYVEFCRGFRNADRASVLVYIEAAGWELDFDEEDFPLQSGHRMFLKPID